MIFSFYHMSTAGSDYRVLTTSDSGFFYGIAEDIDEQDGMINEYGLSHPPQGKTVSKKNQFQPLMLVAMYRGLHAVNPSVDLMDVSQYFSPLLFAISLLGAFLAARELGGDIAGCGAALFLATSVGPIYWSKIGAFDREITLIFFGTWIFYFLLRVFKTEALERLKFSVLAGLFYGMFLITWTGAQFLLAVLVLALILVFLERILPGSGFALTGLILVGGGTRFAHFDVLQLIGVFLILSGLFRISREWKVLENIEDRVVSKVRENISLLGGVVTLIGVSAVVAVGFGEYKPDFLVDIVRRILRFAGMGGGGVSFPQYATEMQPAPSALGDYLHHLDVRLFDSAVLSGFTVALVAVGATRVAWTSRSHEMLALAWIIIVPPMALDQARFFRLFWPMWPIMAGFGLGTLFQAVRSNVLSPSFSAPSWVEELQQPLVLTLIAVVLIVPFVQNARADVHASVSNPAPHGGSLPGNYYHDLLGSFRWIKENTPENSIIGIRWSYGHFLTGFTNRASVTDGAQETGWRGEWQDSPGAKPPDYIKYIEDGKGYFYGYGAGRVRENRVNGRRPDIQRLMTVGDNKFAQIIKLYEDYNVGIDYFVFDYRWSDSALHSNLYNMRSADNYGKVGQDLIKYKFENEVVYLDRKSTNTYFYLGGQSTIGFVKRDNMMKPIGVMVEVLQRTAQGEVRISQVRNLSGFDSKSYVHEFLLLTYLDGGFGDRRGFVKENQGIFTARLCDVNVPVTVEVRDNYGIPEFLDVKYRAPTGKFSVVEINRDKIS